MKDAVGVSKLGKLKKMFALFGMGGIGGILFLPGVTGADQVRSGEAALAYACAACHGPDGHSQGVIPSLDRLSPEHFRDAMRAFRTETRQSTVMHHIAKGLDDADIEAVTAYFAPAQTNP